MPSSDVKNAGKEPKSERNIGVLVTIGAVALILAAGTYFYVSYVADLIRAQAIAESQHNTEVKADDLANIAAEQITSVRSNIVLISNAHLVQVQDVQGAMPLFTTAQDLTKGFTFSYFWLDKDGEVLWVTTFSNLTTFQQYAGFDNSQSSFYQVPLQAKRFYVSEVILAPDGVQRIIFAYPILDANDSSFKGVIGASSNLHDIGNLLKRQSPTVMLLAIDGTILHSSDESLIGANVLDEKFQFGLPENTRSDVISFMRKSLDDSAGGLATGGSSNFEDFTADHQSASLAYHAVIVDDRTAAVVFVVGPHTIATDTYLQLENLRILSFILITGIGAVAVGFGAVVVRWNRRLESQVSTRTSELAARTDQLEKANRDLDVANRDLLRAYEDLKVHDRLQKEFVNVAAHELKTPVQPLLGAAELLETQFGDKQKIEVSKPEIDIILRNAKRLGRLSADILEISRIDSGALKLNIESFSLSYILADAIKDAKTRSYFDGDGVKIVYYPDDIFVKADRGKISQVVSNLLSNATKFSQDGIINITTRKDLSNNTAVVTVTDTGTGIDSEVLPKLFEKFVTKSEHGTGIGLYISKKIIEAHGGRIWGENRSDGIRGATFGFTLSLVDGSVDSSLRDQSSAGKAKTFSRPSNPTVEKIDHDMPKRKSVEV